jgi:hypothetical protein
LKLTTWPRHKSLKLLWSMPKRWFIHRTSTSPRAIRVGSVVFFKIKKYKKILCLNLKLNCTELTWFKLINFMGLNIFWPVKTWLNFKKNFKIKTFFKKILRQ